MIAESPSSTGLAHSSPIRSRPPVASSSVTWPGPLIVVVAPSPSEAGPVPSELIAETR